MKTTNQQARSQWQSQLAKLPCWEEPRHILVCKGHEKENAPEFYTQTSFPFYTRAESRHFSRMGELMKQNSCKQLLIKFKPPRDTWAKELDQDAVFEGD